LRFRLFDGLPSRASGSATGLQRTGRSPSASPLGQSPCGASRKAREIRNPTLIKTPLFAIPCRSRLRIDICNKSLMDLKSVRSPFCLLSRKEHTLSALSTVPSEAGKLCGELASRASPCGPVLCQDFKEGKKRVMTGSHRAHKGRQRNSIEWNNGDFVFYGHLPGFLGKIRKTPFDFKEIVHGYRGTKVEIPDWV